MMHSTESDDRLQAAYSRLMRARSTGASDIPLEQIQALAEGTYAQDDRSELLDRVLANPSTAREFHALRQVVALRPARAQRFAPRWLMAAAAVLAITVGTVSTRRTDPVVESMRGATDAIALIAPTADAPWANTTQFAWNRVEGATSYSVEVVDADGAVAASRTAADTTAQLPQPRVHSSEYRWWVVAHFADQTTRRSPPRTLRP